MVLEYASFLIANMVNLAIRLSVALIFAPRFGIEFVWLAVPAGWFANFFNILCGAQEIIKSIVSGCILQKVFFKHAIEKCFSLDVLLQK